MSDRRSNSDIEQALSDWADEVAPKSPPDRLLESTFIRTMGGKQLRVYPWNKLRLGRVGLSNSGSGARFAIVVLATILLLALAIAFVAGAFRRTAPPSPSPIAFGVHSSGVSNVFSVLSDGTDLQQLTTGTGNQLCASYSADRSLIDYCGDGSGNFEIWTMKADGTQQSQRTHLEGRALWPDSSHDGSKIAFSWVEGADANSEIYVVEASTGDDLVALTSCAGLASDCSNDYPAWSPDDQHIVYIHSDNMDSSGNPVNSQVWVMNADGSNQHALTAGGPNKNQVPNWSPDGTSIVYASGSIAREGIWVMNADGTGQHPLSGCPQNNGDVTPCETGDDFGPVWSPDGTQIAFLRSFEDLGTQDRPIYVMNADGSDQQRVTEAPILAAIPTW